MNKWILTLAITGVLGSAVVNAATLLPKENTIEAENAKPVKIFKKKKASNKGVKKAKRSGNKF
jgi:hypothetical protein